MYTYTCTCIGWPHVHIHMYMYWMVTCTHTHVHVLDGYMYTYTCTCIGWPHEAIQLTHIYTSTHRHYNACADSSRAELNDAITGTQNNSSSPSFTLLPNRELWLPGLDRVQPLLLSLPLQALSLVITEQWEGMV